MEPEMTTTPNSARKRECSSCGTDLNPKVDISIPGLNRLFDKSVGKGKKCIWVIIVSICAVVCVGLTVHQLQEYFRRPIATKIFVGRKDKVQFPSFSICVTDHMYYIKGLENLIKKTCIQNNIQICNVEEILIQELNTSFKDTWDQFYFQDVSVFIESTNLDKSNAKDCLITNKHSILGPCVVITHTEEIPYLSILTQLEVLIRDPTLRYQLIFIPHGQPEFIVNEFEVLNHEMEVIKIGFETKLKILEEVFKLKNTTERLCYDLGSERERVRQQALNQLRDKVCRLPYLPENFPECKTLQEVRRSIFKTYNVIRNLVSSGNWSIRRACEEKIYTISVDYVIPTSLEYGKPDIELTKLTIKFSDDTISVISEYFSYTFPALISDLFAYWGFFLCLSALVFAEMVEYLILKLYQGFTKIVKR